MPAAAAAYAFPIDAGVEQHAISGRRREKCLAQAMVEIKPRAVPRRIAGDAADDMVICPRGRAAQEIIVRQKVRRAASIAPLMIELQRIPEGDKGEDVVALRSFKMKA